MGAHLDKTSGAEAARSDGAVGQEPNSESTASAGRGRGRAATESPPSSSSTGRRATRQTEAGSHVAVDSFADAAERTGSGNGTAPAARGLTACGEPEAPAVCPAVEGMWSALLSLLSARGSTSAVDAEQVAGLLRDEGVSDAAVERLVDLLREAGLVVDGDASA